MSDYREGQTPEGTPQRAQSAERGQAGRAEIAGRYQLQSRLGFGGMSTVHLAFDKRLEYGQ